MNTAALLVALTLWPAAGNKTPIYVVGNEVLPDEVYLSLIDMSGHRPRGRATPKKARKVADQVERFLHKSGYEIATVEGLASDDGLVLNIDEGRVTRLVIRGLGDVSTIQLRLKILLIMPSNIFNRPSLNRQLDDLRDDFGLTDVAIEIKQSPAVDHRGPQLVEYPEVAGITVIQKPAKHELVVTLGKKEWQTGFGFILDLRPPDGVRVGLSYSSRHLIFDDDRYQARASGAINQFGSLVDLRSWTSWTRVMADGLWASPRFFDTGLRLSLAGYYDLKGRQRADIGLQKYYWMQHGVVGSLAYDLDDWLRLSVGGGYEGRWLFEVEQRLDIFDPPTRETIPRVAPFDSAAGMVSIRTEFDFEPGVIRIDQRHTLWLEGRGFFRDELRPRWLVRAEYEKTLALGWHELRLKASGIGQWGPVRFVDEESAGYFLRGVFGTRHWVRRAVGTSTGFRFSITRDVFQVGAFYEQALFEEPARGNPPHRIVYANAFGPSLHFLLFDTMQADFYYSFGIDSDGFFEHGFSAGLRKAF